jgi:hypothetical protein
MEETFFKYGEYLRICWVGSCDVRQEVMMLILGDSLNSPCYKRVTCCEMLHRAWNMKDGLQNCNWVPVPFAGVKLESLTLKIYKDQILQGILELRGTEIKGGKRKLRSFITAGTFIIKSY